MTTDVATYESLNAAPMSRRERLAWWLYDDTGECDACGGPLPADKEPLRMTWGTGLRHFLKPKVAKLCSGACLATHMEVKLRLPGFAGELIDEVEEIKEEHNE